MLPQCLRIFTRLTSAYCAGMSCDPTIGVLHREMLVALAVLLTLLALETK